MIIVINNLKYDTDKMELVSENCEYKYLSVICGDVCMSDGKTLSYSGAQKETGC